MTTFVGLRLKLESIIRWPFDRLIILGLKLLARFKTYFSPKIVYEELGPNDLRVLWLCRPLTKCDDEPVRCTLYHVSLDHNAEYKEFEKQVDKGLRLFKKTRAWIQYYQKINAKRARKSIASRFPWGDYMTLSYAWGDDARSHRIILNGQWVTVTESLDAALRSIRAVFGEDPDSMVRLWVDALCIDQRDIAERGREIRRMRQIYGDALGGFVHIGLSSEDSDLSMQSVASIGKNIKEGFDCQKWLLEVASEVIDGKESSVRPVLVGVMKLYLRRYWSRMWIIQELAMGQDQYVGCGNFWVGLADMRQVLKMLVENAETLDMILPDGLLDGHLPFYQATIALLWYIGRVREMVFQKDEQEYVNYSTLRLPILTLAQYATAADPRDKVYGMMALLPARLAAMIDQHDRNYDLATREVFITFSKAIIEATGDLNVIFAGSFLQKSLSELDLPTWAVDWTLKHDRTSGADALTDWDFTIEEDNTTNTESSNVLVTDSTVSIPNRADGNRRGSVSFSNDNNLLHCHGFCIGTIDGIAAETTSGTGSISLDPNKVTQPQSTSCPYADASAAKDALLRVFLFDATGTQAKDFIIFSLPWFGAAADADALAVCSTLSGDWDFFERLREKGWNTMKFSGGFFGFESLRRRLGMFRVAGRPLKDYFPQVVEECEGELDSRIFKIILSNVISRRLVTTVSGHVGLAPGHVVQGDRIYLLLGSTMPIILRPGIVEGQFELVGECYVDGFMKGEAMEGLDGGNYQLQDIVLC